MTKHLKHQSDWEKVLKEVKDKRIDPKNERFRQDPSRSKLNLSPKSPCEVSLIERSTDFKYDNYSSKVLETMPREQCDYVERRNAYLQSLSYADVTYNQVGRRTNSPIYSTLPSRKELRHDFEKVRTMQKSARRNDSNKSFTQLYNTSGDNEERKIYDSKQARY